MTNPSDPKSTLRDYLSTIKTTEINERPVQLVKWKSDNGRGSEFLSDRIKKDDQAIMLPLMPVSENEFVFVPISIKDIQNINKFRTNDSEIDVIEGRKCSYCGEEIESRTQSVSILGVHVFPFHKICYTEMDDLLSRAVGEFSEYLVSNII